MKSRAGRKTRAEVIEMADFPRYNGLFDLIDNDGESDEFFSALPAYVKDMIGQRAEDIRSKEELFAYADNLLRGDH
jgi:hypothetical protein